MDVDDYGNWVLLASLAFCVLLGAVVLIVVCYTHFKTLKLAIPSLLFGVLGGFLMSSPKWTEVAFKWGDWEGKLTRATQIETELGEAKQQIALLTSQSTELTQVLKARNEKIDQLQFSTLQWTTTSLKQAANFQANWTLLKSEIEKCPSCPAGNLVPATKTVDEVLAVWKDALPLKFNQQQ